MATARALAQAGGAELVGVSTPAAIAAGAGAGDRPVLAVLDARRGEAFAAAFAPDGSLLRPVAALAPETLGALVAGLPAAPLALGDGALRFRAELEAAGAHVPSAEDPRHRVGGAGLCAAAAGAVPVPRDALVPDYVRDPDAKPRAPAAPPPR